MCALQRERRFNLGVIDNKNLKLIKLTAGEDRGKLFNDRESENFVNHNAILGMLIFWS